MEASAGESEDSAPSKKKKKKKKKETQASADLECSSTTASPTGSVRPAINGHIPIAPKLPFDLSELRGRKPVIYLYPPSRLSDVIVELHLTSSWSFSAVYPSPQSANPSVANHIGAQSLTWAIEAEPDGTLVEKTTGVEVTYLYWEAMYVWSLALSAATKIDVDTGFFSAKSHLVTPDVSRATTPVEDIEMFDPSRPSLDPSDSILLPISKIVGYLDVALKALALHTEARTSFITYGASFLCSSYKSHRTNLSFFFYIARVFFSLQFISPDLHLFYTPPKKKLITDGNQISWGWIIWA